MKMDGFLGTFEDFVDLFRKGQTIYNPLIPHVLEGQQCGQEPILRFLHLQLQRQCCSRLELERRKFDYFQNELGYSW
jgi:hypothetical protein